MKNSNAQLICILVEIGLMSFALLDSFFVIALYIMLHLSPIISGQFGSLSSNERPAADSGHVAVVFPKYGFFTLLIMLKLPAGLPASNAPPTREV